MPVETMKFLLITLCFFMALITKQPAAGKRDYLLLAAAMFFTVVSDFFIIMLERNAAGVTFFCVVQLIYFARFSGKPKKIVYCTVFLFTAAAACWFLHGGYLLFISAVYAQCLFLAVFSAIAAYRRKKFPPPNNFMIAAGMVLFFCCDICVMLYNQKTAGVRIGAIETASGVLLSFIWVFYAPSQILLSLSAYSFERSAERVKN